VSHSKNLRKQSKLDKAFIRVYREEALVTQYHKCFYCRDRLSYRNTTAEHIKPKSKNGLNTKENIAGSCEPCNRAKGSMNDSQFKKLIKSFPTGSHWQVIMTWNRRKINIYLERMEKNVKQACK